MQAIILRYPQITKNQPLQPDHVRAIFEISDSCCIIDKFGRICLGENEW
jgi:hypothetical protein